MENIIPEKYCKGGKYFEEYLGWRKSISIYFSSSPANGPVDFSTVSFGMVLYILCACHPGSMLLSLLVVRSPTRVKVF